ncbi:hypothetical protein CAURIC_08730 [Corynebacterium auriscanis]|nr:hypothetical protein CAURIC_08730 [Corynebacterium auriscanis]
MLQDQTKLRSLAASLILSILCGLALSFWLSSDSRLALLISFTVVIFIVDQLTGIGSRIRTSSSSSTEHRPDIDKTTPRS